MGTWGAGTFDNDDASDWVYELENAHDGALVRGALQKVVAQSGYLEAPDACLGLAAAEVVAAAIGRPAPRLPDAVAQWVRTHPAPFEGADRAAAVAAVDRVLGENSELNELWDESGDSAWVNGLHDLRRRLTAD